MLPALHSRETGASTPVFFPRWCSLQFGRDIDVSFKTFDKVFKNSVTCIDVENTDYRYAIVGYGNGNIAIYDTARNLKSNSYSSVTSIDKSTVGAHKFSVDCIQWYPHDTGMFMSLSGDRIVKVWDTNELEVAEKFSFPTDIYSFHMSDKAKRHSTIAVASKDKRIHMCDLKSGSKAHSLGGHLAPVLTVKWSPRNENILCSGSADGQIYMWDFRKAKPHLASFISDTVIGPNQGRVAHQDNINGLCYSNDGLNLLSYGNDNTLKLWDINSQTDSKVDYCTLPNDTSRNVTVAISKGLLKELAYVPCNNNIAVFELLSGNYVQTLYGHFLNVNCLGYNARCQELYSGSTDTQLLIWEFRRNIAEDLGVLKDSWSEEES